MSEESKAINVEDKFNELVERWTTLLIKKKTKLGMWEWVFREIRSAGFAAGAAAQREGDMARLHEERWAVAENYIRSLPLVEEDD